MTEITLNRTVRRRKSYADRTCYDRRIAKAYNGAFSNVLGHDFRIDEKTGRKIRVFTREHWCGSEDVRRWLLNNRVVEIDDALEHISDSVLRWMIRDCYLREDGNGAGYFWITRKAADKYDLPPVLGRAFPC